MLAIKIFFSIFLFVFQEEAPLLPRDYYTYEIEFFLKRKQPLPESEVWNETEKSRSVKEVLPYLIVHFTFKDLEPTDKRIQIYRGTDLLNSKKIKGPIKISMDIGYTIDIKEGVLPGIFTIYILDDNKDRRARVEVKILENGELYINGQKSGMV